MPEPIWDAAQAPLILAYRKFETRDTVSFFFKTPHRGIFDFKPGQFVTLRLDIDGCTHARSYSISSLPGQDYLQLTVKRVANGRVSNWMVDRLQPGATVWTYGVAGAFNIQDCAPKEKVLMISAGCGITPVMAMARSLLASDRSGVKKIDFLHCAKDMQNVIYREELEALATNTSRFRDHLLLERLAPSQAAARRHAGLISLETLRTVAPDYRDATIYLCGPSGFMEGVETMLRAEGFDTRHLFKEAFVSHNDNKRPNEEGAVEGKNKEGIATDTGTSVTVSVPAFDVVQQVARGATLLDVLEQVGVPVIGACRSGVCGSCKCRATKGAVVSSSQATLTPEELAQGYVLACSSAVHEDVEIVLI